MSLYRDLLFLHGHIADPRLAAALSAPAASTAPPSIPQQRPTAGEHPRRHPMDLFKSMLYLGGLQSIDSRIGEEDERFGPTYGNRVASARAFGKPAAGASARRVVPARRRTPATPRVDTGCVTGNCG